MKQTDNFKLNLPELSDKISPSAFNENTVRIDEMLAKGVRMACGTYTGTGAATCSISTPGFTPMAVLMTKRKDAGSYTDNDASIHAGWVMWVGEDLPSKYYEEVQSPDGSTVQVARDTTLQFTPSSGSLLWKLATAGLDPAAAVNNVSGTVYQWIAFGLPSGV